MNNDYHAFEMTMGKNNNSGGGGDGKGCLFNFICSFMFIMVIPLFNEFILWLIPSPTGYLVLFYIWLFVAIAIFALVLYVRSKE